jgi:hypothetical protein
MLVLDFRHALTNSLTGAGASRHAAARCQFGATQDVADLSLPLLFFLSLLLSLLLTLCLCLSLSCETTALRDVALTTSVASNQERG